MCHEHFLDKTFSEHLHHRVREMIHDTKKYGLAHAKMLINLTNWSSK
jgi:hypothetical protein